MDGVEFLRTNIFAHRGASKLAPENTMEAFELAYKMGADGIETDVQLTKDGVPVLIHDENVKRTTNGTGFVKDYTYDDIIQLDAGYWFSKAYDGARIMSLDDFLTWAKPKSLLLNIELKNNKIEYENLESIVYEQIRHHNLLNRTVISTFSAKSIRKMQMYRDKVEIAFLTSKAKPNPIQYALDIGANAVHIKYKLLKPSIMAEAKQENMAVRVYTVNHRMHMLKCFKLNTNGIFTDIPHKGIKMRQHFQ